MVLSQIGGSGEQLDTACVTAGGQDCPHLRGYLCRLLASSPRIFDRLELRLVRLQCLLARV